MMLTSTAQSENKPALVGLVRDKNPLTSDCVIEAGSTQAGFLSSGGSAGCLVMWFVIGATKAVQRGCCSAAW